MATTTNYSWTTPDDTALVKDGAAAIRSLGTAIDTTVFTNAGNAIAKTIVDAKGDLIVATAADTVARLAVGGTNGHVLQVDSSTASGLKWDSVAAGGMTLISTTTLTGASVTLSSIPQTYIDLVIIFRNFLPATDYRRCRMQFNSDTGTNYVGFNTSPDASGTANFTESSLVVHSAADNAVSNNLARVHIPDYKNTSTYKQLSVQSIAVEGGGTPNITYAYYAGFYGSTSAITSIDIFPQAGNFTSGTVLLYGVK